LTMPNRQLHQNGTKILCDKRPQLLVIKMSNKYISVSKDGTIKEVNISSWQTDFESTNLVFQHIYDYDRKLVENLPKPLEPFSLMQIMSHARETMDELIQLRAQHSSGGLLFGLIHGIGSLISSISTGTGTIIHEIGSSLRNIIDGIADPDRGLIHAIGDATSDIITSGGDAVNKVEEGVSDILFKNLGSIIVLGILVLLGLFFVVRYKTMKSQRPTKQDVTNDDVSKQKLCYETMDDITIRDGTNTFLKKYQKDATWIADHSTRKQLPRRRSAEHNVRNLGNVNDETFKQQRDVHQKDNISVDPRVIYDTPERTIIETAF